MLAMLGGIDDTMSVSSSKAVELDRTQVAKIQCECSNALQTVLMMAIGE
jgi:hypothetical protein